jgi:hypothetical protein
LDTVSCEPRKVFAPAYTPGNVFYGDLTRQFAV